MSLHLNGICAKLLQICSYLMGVRAIICVHYLLLWWVQLVKTDYSHELFQFIENYTFVLKRSISECLHIPLTRWQLHVSLFIHSVLFCSTCQCGFSLPARPRLEQAYLGRRPSDEQKPIKVFRWMLLFWVATIAISFYYYFSNWPSTKNSLKVKTDKRKQSHVLNTRSGKYRWIS